MTRAALIFIKRKRGLGWWAKVRRAGLVTVRAHKIEADYIPRFQQEPQP